MNSLLSKLSRTKNLLAFFCLLFIFTAGNLTVLAATNSGQPMNLSQALDTAVQENNELQDIKADIKNLQRDIESIKAGQGWNIDIRGDYTYYSEDDRSFPDTQADTGDIETDGGYDSLSFGLDSSRELAGFLIRPSFRIHPLESDQITDFELSDDSELRVDVSRVLYPLLPTESQRQLERMEDNLSQLKDSYQRQKNEQQHNWIASYLELLRQQDRLEIQQQYLSFVEEELARTEKQQQIGEAGEYELRQAEINKREAEISFRRQQNTFEQLKEDFQRELGLPSGREIKLASDDRLLEDLTQQLQQKENILVDKNELQQHLIANSIELQSLDKEIEWAQTELEWTQKEQGPQVDFSGSVNVVDNEWQAGVTLSYNLYDGGRDRLEVTKQQETVADLKTDYEDLVDSLIVQLERRLSGLELLEEEKEIARLKLEQQRADSKHIAEKLELGTVSELEYRQQLVGEKETEVDLQAAKDELFMEQLYLLEFVGLY